MGKSIVIAQTFKSSCDDVCDDWLPMAGDEDETDWVGERTGNCSDNIGSHLRDINLGQLHTEHEIDTNSMKIRCCFPKTMMSTRCHDYDKVAELGQWSDNVQGYCDMKAGGNLQSLLLSQEQIAGGTAEVNGLMIRCCYPF
ncbi:MAG TPA: hypothetical protein VNJ08_06005 [Bacteriovoracaceae bacterium]|nr:hypothetical protein [Bacteriovoracaceae bacterium]